MMPSNLWLTLNTYLFAGQLAINHAVPMSACFNFSIRYDSGANPQSKSVDNGTAEERIQTGLTLRFQLLFAARNFIRL